MKGFYTLKNQGESTLAGHPVIFVLLIFCSRIYFYHQKKNCNNILFVNWDNFICMTKLYTWQTKFWYLFFITQKIVAIIISDNLLLGQFFHDTYIMMTNIFNFFFDLKISDLKKLIEIIFNKKKYLCKNFHQQKNVNNFFFHK